MCNNENHSNINITNNVNGCHSACGDHCNSFDMPEGLIIPGRARIINVENGLYLTNSNGKLTQEIRDINNANQIWTFEPLEPLNTFTINSNDSTNAIGLSSRSTEDGLPIIVANDNGSTNFQWQVRYHIVSEDDTLTSVRIAYQFQNIFSGKAITNPNGSSTPGTQMVQSTRKIFVATNQVFIFERL